ncbi:MAG: YbaN family protein [Paludibacteraceae bacterium]|nr:YbaN family protein [Paludibacteraceae bacterium]
MTPNHSSKQNHLRYLFILAGSIAVVLGTIGIVVPGLPTTPFVLLASWCFYKSSTRLQAWLLQSFLGKYIIDYQQKGGITTRKRIYIVLLMLTMVSISLIFFIHSTTLRIIVAAAALIGCIVVGFIIPKAKNDSH